VDPQLRTYVEEWETALLGALNEYDRKIALTLWMKGVETHLDMFAEWLEEAVFRSGKINARENGDDSSKSE